jgi:hypothetical protein
MFELKRWIAEKFFMAQLDEDFISGIERGKVLARAEARFYLELCSQGDSNKYSPGLAKAIEHLRDPK